MIYYFILVLRSVFDHFDKNRNGRLSVSEFDKVLAQLNIKLTREQFANLLRDADRDGQFIIFFFVTCNFFLIFEEFIFLRHWRHKL